MGLIRCIVLAVFIGLIRYSMFEAYMGLYARKPVSGLCKTTQAQTSLRICPSRYFNFLASLYN